jgi:transcriptional regulator with GAF, ATPase, and Fis domain
MASMNQLDAIVSIALDLRAALSSEERYRPLLGALRRVIPYDAAALLGLEETELLPIVAEGLSAARATSNRCLADEVLCRLSPNNRTTRTQPENLPKLASQVSDLLCQPAPLKMAATGLISASCRNQ